MVTLDFILPGLINQDYTAEDYAFGPISRIDHAHIKRGVLVPMHEHTNDEIISYMFKGQMFHEDSDGNSENISPGRLMLMGAGKSFWHQESTRMKSLKCYRSLFAHEKKILCPKYNFIPVKLNKMVIETN